MYAALRIMLGTRTRNKHRRGSVYCVTGCVATKLDVRHMRYPNSQTNLGKGTTIVYDFPTPCTLPQNAHLADTEFGDRNTPFVLPTNALNLRQTQCRTHRYKTLTCNSTLAAPKQRGKFLIRSVLNKFHNDLNLPQQILHKPTKRERLCEKLSKFCC